VAASSPALQRHAYEVILSNSNPFIGTRVTSKELHDHYGAVLLGVRLTHSNALHAGLTVHSSPPPSVSEVRADIGSTAIPTTVSDPSTGGNANMSLASVGDVRLHSGDSLLLLARRDFLDDYGSGRARDLFVANRVAGASKVAPVGWFQYGSLVLLILMFVLGSVGVFEME
jgi:hypothetical protein